MQWDDMDLMRVKLQNDLNAPVVNLQPNPFSISTYTENLITTRRFVAIATYVLTNMPGHRMLVIHARNVRLQSVAKILLQTI